MVEATGEIARLATKVEELELKAKMLMMYKAEHGTPESAVELKQKVEKLQVEFDAEVVKTTGLESSIDSLKRDRKPKAETHESVVERLQNTIMEKQKLEIDVTKARETVAQFGEELATAEQLRKEEAFVLIDMQKEIDDSKRLCASHEQLLEQVQEEL